MELLAARPAKTLRKPFSDPLQNDIVIVQNLGMERWVSMQLALRHGICANVRFPSQGYYFSIKPRSLWRESLFRATANPKF